MNPLVRRVDHVFVPVEDPEPLFSLFTSTLGLPEAWPIHDYGPFRSGGVSLGNCNLEFVAGDAGVNPYLEARLPSVVRGIAFEPEPGTDWRAQLDARGLSHSDVLPFEGKGCHGDEGVLWSNVFLGGMVATEAVAFLCEYHVDECLRGEPARRALADSGGGAIGLEEVDEVTLGLQNTENAMERWQRLLDPVAASEPGYWRLGDGPAIRIRESPLDGVVGLVLKVRSLGEARKALMERNLLGPVRKHGMGLHYARTHGLDVWLTE